MGPTPSHHPFSIGMFRQKVTLQRWWSGVHGSIPSPPSPGDLRLAERAPFRGHCHSLGWKSREKPHGRNPTMAHGYRVNSLGIDGMNIEPKK